MGKKSGFGGFEKNLINLYLPFFTWIWKYYWYSNFLQKLCSWVLFQKYLDRSEWMILSQKWVELWRWIFVCDQTFIEATNLFKYFKWVWPGMPRYVQIYVKLWINFISRVNWAERCFLHVVRGPKNLKICWIISSG